ncbi:MAG: hypothetical protein KGK30_05560 [Elusimicrobia bacterium]|nr:hypothetical protein [Elusimicrobiota bacterium]
MFSDHVSGVLAGLEPAAAALKSNAPEQATRLYWEHHLLVRGHVAAGLAGSLEPLASRVEHPAARENLLSVARTLRTASVTPKQAVEAAFAAPWIEPLENPPSLVARQDSLLEEAASGLRRLRRCAGEAKGRDFDRGLLRGLAAVAPALEAFTNSNNSTGNGGFTDLEFWTLHARLYYSIAEALAASTEALLPRLTDPAIAASLSAWAAALRTPLPDTQGMDISYPPSFWFGAALSQKQQLSQAAAALHALLSRYGLE